MKFRVKNRSMLPIWVEVDGEDIPTLQLVSEKNQYPLPSAYLGREAQSFTFVRAATRRRISGNSAREIDISIHVEDGNVPFRANLRWSPSSSPSETIGKKISAMFPRIGSRKSPVERLRSHFYGAGAIRTVVTEEYSEAFELVSGNRESPLRQEIREFLSQEVPVEFEDISTGYAFRMLSAYVDGALDAPGSFDAMAVLVDESLSFQSESTQHGSEPERRLALAANEKQDKIRNYYAQFKRLALQIGYEVDHQWLED